MLSKLRLTASIIADIGLKIIVDVHMLVKLCQTLRFEGALINPTEKIADFALGVGILLVKEVSEMFVFRRIYQEAVLLW